MLNIVILDGTKCRCSSNEKLHISFRVSLAVQRYNSVIFRGTFSVPLNWTSATPACFVFNFCFNPVNFTIGYHAARKRFYRTTGHKRIGAQSILGEQDIFARYYL